MPEFIKNWFSYLSISKKLNLIAFLTLSTTVTISAIAIIGFDQNQSKKQLITQSKLLSNILGERSAASILFLDIKTANVNLSSLNKREETLYACIYGKNNKLFSVYEKNNFNKCPENMNVKLKDEGSLEYDNQIITISPIMLKGKPIGQLVLSSSLEKLNKRSYNISLIVLTILVISSFIALLVTRKLQKTITGPILELSKVAEKITKNQDYSIRATSVFNDETQILTRTFNQMLHHIQGVQLEMSQFINELKEDSQKSQDEADEQIERNESIRHYFSGVTHDLKQPLQAIEMFSSILVTSPEDQRDVVNSKLRASVANLRQMFDDWLNVSKLEDSLKQLNKSKINIKSLLYSIVSEVSVLANDKNLKLKVYCPDYIIYSNAKMIDRIVRNLLSNAIRYTEKGGIILACRICDSGYKIQVSDTGIGIDDEKQQFVFDKFTQVSENKQLTGQGYGLGLSIVKKFCDTLGHDIVLKSRINLGTTFSIIIKNKTEINIAKKSNKKELKYNRRISDQKRIIEKETINLTDNKPNTQTNNQSKNNQTDNDKKTNYVTKHSIYNVFSTDSAILVLDDDPIILDAIVSQLNNWGADVVGVTTPEDAINCIANKEFKLIISDYQLGEDIDGVSVLKQIEAYLINNNKKAIYSFIITASLDKRILNDIKQSKYDYMAKPLKPAKLRAKIEFILKNEV
ncbi:MAG: response regulator [Saccharospirillaceae bacterium]|nr:ATP-binding protein [Pseudomonadales bacterium]NRB80164.1 response regulator [Saccharospirillaceae bacterium]